MVNRTVFFLRVVSAKSSIMLSCSIFRIYINKYKTLKYPGVDSSEKLIFLPFKTNENDVSESICSFSLILCNTKTKHWSMNDMQHCHH